MAKVSDLLARVVQLGKKCLESKARVESANKLFGAMVSKNKKKKKSDAAAAATGVPIFAIDADDAARHKRSRRIFLSRSMM